MSEIKQGAILNYFNIILYNLIGLLITPYMIKKLGNDEYGLYTLIGSFIGYLAILDFGLHHTIIRYIAKYRAENDSKGEENFLGTTFLIYMVIGIIVSIVGVIIYYNLSSIFDQSLTYEQFQKAKVMFAILVFNLAISLPGGAFKAICLGYEVFVFPKAIDIIRYIIRSVMLIVLLFYGGKAISIVILDTSLNLIVIATMMYFVKRKLHSNFKIHFINSKFILEIFKYSFWIFILMLIAQFQWKGGQVIVGILKDTSTVAIYAVGLMLGGYYGAFSTAISSLFLPKATQMNVKKSTSKELTDLMIKIGRISLFVLMFVYIGFLFLGKDFIHLWVGISFKESWIIAVLIMSAYTIPLTQSFANTLLEAKNKIAYKSIILLITISLGTFVGALLTNRYGNIGMISGICFGWIIGQGILNYYYQNKIKLDVIFFFKKVFVKNLPGMVLATFLAFIISKIPSYNSWLIFGSKGLLYTIIYWQIIYWIQSNNYEKGLIRGMLNFKFI